MVGRRRTTETAWLLLFLGPSLGALLVFTIGPIVASLALTLFEWDLLTPPTFVAFQNFAELARDRDFWAALRHTLLFIAGYVPLVTVCALLVALALNTSLRGIGLVRTA